MIVLALPKGRVLEEAVALFGRAGYDLSPVLGDTRKLVFDLDPLRVLVVKPVDVPIYVEHGAADVGVAGRDVIEEEGAELYEPLDLKIGVCRLVVAEPIDRPVDERSHIHLRIATKYERITRQYLQRKGLFGEVIKISGSVELAPMAGLCDRIVDLVSSGETLRANALREIETILPVTSRLVVNRAGLKLRGPEIDRLLGRLRKVL